MLSPGVKCGGSFQAERQCFHHVQVYYGAWRGLEVAVKVMSADITQHVAAGLEVSQCSSCLGMFSHSIRLYRCHPAPVGVAAIWAVQQSLCRQHCLW